MHFKLGQVFVWLGHLELLFHVVNRIQLDCADIGFGIDVECLHVQKDAVESLKYFLHKFLEGEISQHKRIVKILVQKLESR